MMWGRSTFHLHCTVNFRPIAVIYEVEQTQWMGLSRSLLLALFLTGCGQVRPSNQQQESLPLVPRISLRSEFLQLVGNDSWARWPVGLTMGTSEDIHPCQRVSEQARERAIIRLSERPAVALDAREYRALVGTFPPRAPGRFYLLRGFSTNNSQATVRVTGDGVTVDSYALGGLFNLRRHPCVAMLRTAPSEVYTTAGYDY